MRKHLLFPRLFAHKKMISQYGKVSVCDFPVKTTLGY